MCVCECVLAFCPAVGGKGVIHSVYTVSFVVVVIHVFVCVVTIANENGEGKRVYGEQQSVFSKAKRQNPRTHTRWELVHCYSEACNE